MLWEKRKATVEHAYLALRLGLQCTERHERDERRVYTASVKQATTLKLR